MPASILLPWDMPEICRFCNSGSNLAKFASFSATAEGERLISPANSITPLLLALILVKGVFTIKIKSDD